MLPCQLLRACMPRQVKQATDNRTGEVVAVKFVEKPPLEGQERMWKVCAAVTRVLGVACYHAPMLQVLRSEIACLERVRMLGGHAAVVKLHEVCG